MIRAIYQLNRLCKSVKPLICLIFGTIAGFLFSSYVSYTVLNVSKCFKDSSVLHSLPQQVNATPRKLLFIGVMTADKYVSSRAASIHKTWGVELGADLVFFTSENSSTVNDIPLVKLKGVDDAYPPQKKSFMMLHYMYEKLVDRYEYFMRADDDLYVRVGHLKKFLRHLNSTEPLYIGQPGTGISTEQDQLGLENEQNYCMGGPGMIFSHTALNKIGPNIASCYGGMKTNHEDVEIGRCMQKFVGCPCTWSYDMRSIFHHVQTPENQLIAQLRKTNIENAITLHPFKHPEAMYKIHVFSEQMQIRSKESRTVDAMRKFRKICDLLRVLPQEDLDKAHLGIFLISLGSDATLEDGTLKKILPWDYMNKSVFGYKERNPKHKPMSDSNQGITDIIRGLMIQLDSVSNERGRVLVFKKLLYGYQRLYPGVSSQYIVDVLMLYRQYRGSKRNLDVRKHAYLQQPFGPVYVRLSSKESSANKDDHLTHFLRYIAIRPGQTDAASLHNSQKERITFLVPLAGRLETFKRFIENYENHVLKRKENVRLLIIHYKSLNDQDDKQSVYTLTSRLQWKYASPLEIVQKYGTFSRAEALMVGSSYCERNELMFFVDVDIYFNSDALSRIRWHTSLNEKVYFPIVFSEYNTHSSHLSMRNHQKHFLIKEDSGYWRKFGFGIVAIYKSDFENVGGFNTSIKGWGGEDVDLFNKVVLNSNLDIVRTEDPGLVHVFHEIYCDPALPKSQLIMCEQSAYNTFTSSSQLLIDIEKSSLISDL